MLDQVLIPAIKNETEVRYRPRLHAEEQQPSRKHVVMSCCCGPTRQACRPGSERHTTVLPDECAQHYSWRGVFCCVLLLQRRLLQELSSQGELIEASLKQLQQVQQLQATYKVLPPIDSA